MEQPKKPEGPTAAPIATNLTFTSTPALRRDSLRPRTPSTISTKTLLTALNLVMLSITALKNGSETPNSAKTPERAATIGKLLIFVRDAWSEETFEMELAKAEKQLPTLSGLDAAVMCVGLWLWEAVAVLRKGGLRKDADDLEAICAELKGDSAETTGTSRVMKKDERADAKE